MTAAPQNTVEVSASLRLIAPDATALPVAATLIYRLDDPIALEIIFNPSDPGGEPVTWWFARDLLVDGLDHPSGEGDVCVWPWATPRGDYVALAFSSPDGNALFEVPRAVLVRFLRRTYRLFPRRYEDNYRYFGHITGATDFGDMTRPAYIAAVSPLAYMLTRAASLLGGSRRADLETWLADLQGDPELELGLTPRRQVHLAAGFLLASVRFRLRDLGRLLTRALDQLVAFESRILLVAAIVTLLAAGQLWVQGGLTRVWENGENLAAIGGLVWGAGAILRRRRAVLPGDEQTHE